MKIKPDKVWDNCTACGDLIEKGKPCGRCATKAKYAPWSGQHPQQGSRAGREQARRRRAGL